MSSFSSRRAKASCEVRAFDPTTFATLELYDEDDGIDGFEPKYGAYAIGAFEQTKQGGSVTVSVAPRAFAFNWSLDLVGGDTITGSYVGPRTP